MPVARSPEIKQSLKGRFDEYLRDSLGVRESSTLLLAVSGGVDSVVMLDLFTKTNHRVAIAHCNFGLRGKDSDEDANFLKELAKRESIPFYQKRFNTEAYGKRKGISIQMAARDLRYEWFESLIKKNKFDYLATAHHMDDAIETMTLNLIRGPSITGLAGLPSRRSNIIRPLLFAAKDELVEYARSNNLKWREDKSNQETTYRRNLVRLEVLPKLVKENPGLISLLYQLLPKFQKAALLLGDYTEQKVQKFTKQKSTDIIISWQILEEPFGFLVLFEILKKYGFNYHQIQALLSIEQPGKRFDSKTHSILVDRKRWILSQLQEDLEMSIKVSKNTCTADDRFGNYFFYRKHSSPNISKDKFIAELDYSKLKFPLQIRPWKSGDRFQPLGMRGKKKISDFMIDQKIPVNLKRRVKVLTSGDDIIWVVGHRIDERYKVKPQTQESFIVKFINHD